MANAKIPGPIGTFSTAIDTGTLARTGMPQPGVVGTNNIKSSTEMEQVKLALAMDIAQLILDITGIADPTPASDGVNVLISLARGNWFDATISAVSIIPYAGDLAKAAKLPRYIDSVCLAIRIAKVDPKWAKALYDVFVKLKQVLDKCIDAAVNVLPGAILKQLKKLKSEIENFLQMKGGTTGKSSGGGKTGGKSSNTTKSQSKSSSSKPAGKTDKNPENGHGQGTDDGPKTTAKTTPARKTRNATQEDAKKIDSIRDKYGAGKGKNIAHAKGEIGGEKIDLESVSGKVTPENAKVKGNFDVPEEHHYKGVSGYENHTEQKIVEHLRAKYKDTPDISGKIDIISERPYCDNCVDVVDQFQKEFKNIDVTRVEVKK